MGLDNALRRRQTQPGPAPAGRDRGEGPRRRLTTVIQDIDDRPDISVEWDIKRHKADK